MSKIHTCTCGFQWEHGRSGAHQCEPFYHKRIEALEKQNAELLAALLVSKTALEHDVPYSCWATGPLTGDPIEDLVFCPGCRAIHKIDACMGKMPSTNQEVSK